MNIILALTSLILFGVFLIKPKWGLYLMAFLLPVIGFDLSFGILAIPPVDLVALLLLLAFILRYLFNFFFIGEKNLKIKWPLFLPFALFLLVSFISSILSITPFYSIWYFFRWPLFLYFAYIFIPFNLINDKKTLKYVLITTTFSSLIVVIFGLLSLYGQDISNSFFRVRSISLFGYYPFGENHNLIAEFLNVGTFFILSLRILAKDNRFKRFLDIIFILSVATIILSFSRSGWIVLALQSIAYIYLYFKDKKIDKKQLAIPIIILLILLSPFVFKMESLQDNNTSSTENRLILTDIAIKGFLEKPLIGQGSGQYIKLVEKDIRFRAKYGDAIDSHGVLQKVLAENGILGLISWLFILIVILITFYKALIKYGRSTPWLIPLMIGSVGGLFFQFFNTSYYKGKVWLPIVITLLAIELLQRETRKKSKKEIGNK